MELWKNAGIRVIPVVASVALARRMERAAGADAVVAEGCESGGHIGETTTMALVLQVADAVKFRSLRPVELRTDAAWQQPLCWVPRRFRWERVCRFERGRCA